MTGVAEQEAWRQSCLPASALSGLDIWAPATGTTDGGWQGLLPAWPGTLKYQNAHFANQVGTITELLWTHFHTTLKKKKIPQGTYFYSTLQLCMYTRKYSPIY